MSEELLLFLNGEILPPSAARISPFDRGLLWGDGVYETTPCFRGSLFRLEDHIERLYRSLRYVQIDPGMDRHSMIEATLKLHDENKSRLPPRNVYRVGHWITRGEDSPSLAATDAGPATILISYRPVDADAIARDQLEGIRLSIVPTRRTPSVVVDPRAKVTSKMNQILAELDAVAHGAKSLMLDLNGNVAENSTANFFIVRNGALWTAPDRHVLEGVTRKAVLDLAAKLRVAVHKRFFTVYDVMQAEEMFLTASTSGITPVREVDRFQTPLPIPGPISRKLMDALAKECGFDYRVAQQTTGDTV